MSQAENNVDISIIIVNYNVKEFLANCLTICKKSFRRPFYRNICVDNNSTDGSIPFLKKRFEDVNYIENNKNLGFGKANNQAIKQAKGNIHFC